MVHETSRTPLDRRAGANRAWDLGDFVDHSAEASQVPGRSPPRLNSPYEP